MDISKSFLRLGMNFSMLPPPVFFPQQNPYFWRWFRPSWESCSPVGRPVPCVIPSVKDKEQKATNNYFYMDQHDEDRRKKPVKKAAAGRATACGGGGGSGGWGGEPTIGGGGHS